MKILFVIYDNGNVQSYMPLGTLYVAAYLRKAGYADIHFYNQDIYHYPESHLTEYLSQNHFDVVGIGFVAGYYQHKKVISICEAINKAKDRPFVVLGGHGPTPVPEFYLEKTGADAVVLGEGEIPFLNLVKALESNKPLTDIKGIAFRAKDRVVVNQRQEPIKDLGTIPHPYVEKLPMLHYLNTKIQKMRPEDRLVSMITGRGCNYKCNFCQRLEKGIRFRPAEDVVDEIKKYVQDYGVTYIIFWDELFMYSERRVTELAEAIIREGLKIKYWCTGRLNIVNERILDLMKRSGCAYIDYGIEQFDDAALKAMDKCLTEEQVIRGIELTKKAGIWIGFNIIFGNVGDTRQSLQKSMELLKRYNDHGQLRVIRPVTPYPGSPLYYDAIEKGLLKGPDDFYDKHKNVELLTVNFTDIPDEEFYKMLYRYNSDIIREYYSQIQEQAIDSFRKVYFEDNYDFRGARHSV